MQQIKAYRIYNEIRGALRFVLATSMLSALLPVGVLAQDRTFLVKDSLTLTDVYVFGKTKAQKIHDGAYSVSIIDLTNAQGSTGNLTDIIDRMAGMKIRHTGGTGADYSVSVNGMSGNSIRVFIDGTPLNQLGNNVTLQNIPLSSIDRVEIYKGVAPAEFGADALGGVINIVTKRKNGNYLDASISAGSFHTYNGDVSGRWMDSRTGIYIHPQISYTHSKNDYTMKGMKVWSDEREEYIRADRKRFHDAYGNTFISLETGMEKKPWADALSLAFSYTKTDKELQTGAVQNIVYGDAERKMEAWNVQARYRKHDFLLKGLDANVLISHTWDNTLLIDTVCRRYDWNGNYVVTDRNETTGRSNMLRRIKRPLFISRINLNYAIADNHSLNLNYMLTSTGNNRSDDLMLDYDFVPSKDRLTKNIIGLTYNQSFLDERLTNSFFVKDYVMTASIGQTDFAWKTNLDEVGNHISNNNIGGGAASRYRICNELNVKASYERAIRQPLARELLGNGNNIYANLSLRPELSHNINVGLFGTAYFFDRKHKLTYEVNGFMRYVQDYIHAVVSESEGTYQYENVQDVDVQGVEGDVNYSFEFGKRNMLELSANATWLEAINKNRYTTGHRPSVIYGNRIPNAPWLFGNGEATYTRKGLFSKQNKLRLAYRYQYVHWFYLTWEGYGALQSKSTIPTQHCHSAELSYSWHKDRYMMTLECENLADATLYDNYKLQKPGRSLMAKFRYLLK